MDLPPCPNCGEALALDGPRGPASCPACGLKTPIELEAGALQQLLREAEDRGLGRRPTLAPASSAPDPRLEPGTPPSMLGAAAPSPVPTLSPPTRPRELALNAPPPMADPRAPMDRDAGRRPETPLREAEDREEERRRDELRPRGELMR